MNKRMSKIEELLTTLTFAYKNTGGGGNDDKNRDKDKDDKTKRNRERRERERKLMQLHRNMGAFCHSCGFCPIGKDHTSITCQWKKANHNDNAMWTNRGTNPCMTWPARVCEDQQSHESWAGKSAPTN
jgi:hypothetical protein